jgi:hypothetical protein
MTSVERREFLANRSPESQKLILAKIHEYEGLTPEARELRLRVTELRWYLLPLLSTPMNDRAEKLSAIPAPLRELVEARLQEWDKLQPDVKKDLLENESTIRFYFELASRTTAQRAEIVTNVPPDVQNQLDAGFRRWRSLTENQREAALRHFSEYFDLTPTEKQKTLSVLSEAERAQIEKTLQTFGSLSPSQRAECLRSFQRFANLTVAERQQFLKNAARWERMSPSERQSWRSLVSNLSHEPPLPPGLQTPPNPPLPNAVLHPQASPSTSWATNSN